MDNPKEFIAMCVKCIDTEDLETYEELLDFIPINLTSELTDFIVVNLVKYCSDLESEILGRKTLEFWNSRTFPSLYLEDRDELKKLDLNSTTFLYKNVEVIRHKGNRFLSYSLYRILNDSRCIKFVIKILDPSATFSSLIRNLIYDIDKPDISILCEILDSDVFGKTNYDSYFDLYQESKNLNIGISTYLEGRLNKFYAEIPSHVDSSKIKIFESPKLLDYPMLTKREACKYAIEMMFPGEKLEGKEFNASVEHLMKQDIDIERLSKNKFFGPIDVFADYGPSNRNPVLSEVPDELCIRYNCRMLLCTCRDGLDDYGELNDWFTGNCQFCHRLIRSRSHCLRIPIITGGWDGCFCSFNCIKTHMEENFECDIQTRFIYNVVRQMQIVFKTSSINDTIEAEDDKHDIIKMERSCLVTEDDLGNFSCKMDN